MRLLYIGALCLFFYCSLQTNGESCRQELSEHGYRCTENHPSTREADLRSFAFFVLRSQATGNKVMKAYADAILLSCIVGMEKIKRV